MRINWSIVFAVLLILSIGSFAKAALEAGDEASALLDSKIQLLQDDHDYYSRNWSIGLRTSTWLYLEREFMSDRGTLNGFAGSYRYWFSDNTWMGELRADYVSGTTKYIGGYQDGTPLEYTGDRHNISNFKAIWGPTSVATSQYYLQPWFGIGVRSLDSITDEKDGKYDRFTTYTYVPVGLKGALIQPNGWVYEAELEYDILASARVKTELSDIDSKYDDVNLISSEGNGYKARIGASYMASGVTVSLGLSYQFWWIQSSKLERVTFNGQPTNSGVYEPKNETHVTGVDLAVNW